MEKTVGSILSRCDNGTIAHSLRVSKLAKVFGGRLGLTATELNVLQKGALLHDVGKQLIPRRILNKNGELSEKEYAIVQLHPKHGYILLKPVISVYRDVLDIILYHHETIDGRGYPDGLRGDNIPKLARILTIVDAFDAMTNNRVYKRALGRGEALLEIERNLGKQFDPVFGHAFIELCYEKWGQAIIK